MNAGTRVRFNDRCAWPERRGCVGIVVAPPSDGTYPQPSTSEVLVLLDADPLKSWPDPLTGGGLWSCCTDRRSLDVIARDCTHVPEGAWNHCRVPGEGERWVECPCCRGRGVARVSDDLANPPMVCPSCGVAAAPYVGGDT